MRKRPEEQQIFLVDPGRYRNGAPKKMVEIFGKQIENFALKLKKEIQEDKLEESLEDMRKKGLLK